MVRSQGKSRRESSGGLRRRSNKKRKHELGGFPVFTTIGEKKTKEERERGGSTKHKALTVNEAAVQKDDGTGETTEILDVVENEADPHYVRRNIITKGCVIETSLGRAQVTNRPAQEGSVNAVLLDEE